MNMQSYIFCQEQSGLAIPLFHCTYKVSLKIANQYHLDIAIYRISSEQGTSYFPKDLDLDIYSFR
jgi:hypothetical protein